ncbi:hypothetical protein C8J55DRAFT_567786 [Lentinula edodes]|uniref:Amino acid permease/ SLC12A domain-containing protein n=1 Tax=Lentinula lateritia TaxID=40482 RepID=A0A9W9DC23_9AGAR|nr:hypothetical protein C8J55DRAFT_567786 [Lentinula edodes]
MSSSYVALKSPLNLSFTNSPPTSSASPRRQSRDSEDSLRVVEISDGVPLAEPSHHSRNRSFSMRRFDFDLIPLSTSLTDPDMVHGEHGENNISLLNGIALVVGMQIGSRIFSSAGVVVANTRTVGANLCVWIASGLLGWTGASSFAELGSAIPQNGGAQGYLAYAYGPLLAYLFAWTEIIALRPGGDNAHDPIRLCIWSVFIIVLGIVQLARGKASPSLGEPWFKGSSTSPSENSLAFYSGLWAFDGSDRASYVAG